MRSCFNRVCTPIDTDEAESLFERAFGSLKVKDWGELGFEVRGSELFSGRRRFEAVPYNPGVVAIWRHLAKNGKGFIGVREAGFDVWLPTRFRRIPAEDGVWLLDSADLFEANPDLTKRIADGAFGDPNRGRVKTGWLLLARSGQTYGINGSVVLATEALHDKVVSDHVIRIAPRADAKFRTGYLHVALSHPALETGKHQTGQTAGGMALLSLCYLCVHPCRKAGKGRERRKATEGFTLEDGF